MSSTHSRIALHVVSFGTQGPLRILKDSSFRSCLTRRRTHSRQSMQRVSIALGQQCKSTGRGVTNKGGSAQRITRHRERKSCWGEVNIHARPSFAPYGKKSAWKAARGVRSMDASSGSSILRPSRLKGRPHRRNSHIGYATSHCHRFAFGLATPSAQALPQ